MSQAVSTAASNANSGSIGTDSPTGTSPMWIIAMVIGSVVVLALFVIVWRKK